MKATFKGRIARGLLAFGLAVSAAELPVIAEETEEPITETAEEAAETEETEEPQAEEETGEVTEETGEAAEEEQPEESEDEEVIDESLLTYIDLEPEYEVPESQRNSELLFSEPLEPAYDARSGLPKVRNQSPYGSCWTFASIGALEADMIHDGVYGKEEIDLSELQLGYFTAHNYTDPKGNHTGDEINYTGTRHYLDNGGNAIFAYRAMAGMVGAVNESDVPYDQAETLVPDMKYAVSSDAVQLTNAFMIPAADRDGIKHAIREHGGVAAAMHVLDRDRYYNKANNCYYYYSEEPSTDHAVMLVGWDDNFDRTKFNTDLQPKENGAWLVRNSWGKDSECFNGYFWISYEDSGVNKSAVAAYDGTKETADHCYSYDTVPYPGTVYRVKTGKADLSTSYIVDGNEWIERIGFEIGSADADVTAEVSDGKEPAAGTVHTSYAGFYTIVLNKPLYISERKNVTVSLHVESESGAEIVILAEGNGTSVKKGIEYTGATSGPGFTLNSKHYEKDARVKLFTKDGEGIYGTAVHQKETMEKGVFETFEEVKFYTLTPGTEVTPMVRDQEGFTSPEAQSVVISESGKETVTYSYTRNSYQAVFQAGKCIESVSGSGTYLFEAEVEPEATCKTGYEVDHWSEISEVPFKMPAKNLTVTAEGKPITYTISYDLDGGSITDQNPEEYNIESEPITLLNPQKKGYTFLGWSGTDLEGNDNRSVRIETGSTGNRTYRANWIETRVMYRMYNPNSGEHFYTKSTEERENLVNAGWKYEGVGFRSPLSSDTPMYRLYNPNAGDHHYTRSEQEKDSLIASGWKYEGIGWYADDNREVAQYRLYNPNAVTGSHHYTSNETEKQNLIDAGWKYEGIGFYTCR